MGGAVTRPAARKAGAYCERSSCASQASTEATPVASPLRVSNRCWRRTMSQCKMPAAANLGCRCAVQIHSARASGAATAAYPVVHLGGAPRGGEAGFRDGTGAMPCLLRLPVWMRSNPSMLAEQDHAAHYSPRACGDPTAQGVREHGGECSASSRARSGHLKLGEQK